MKQLLHKYVINVLTEPPAVQFVMDSLKGFVIYGNMHALVYMTSFM